MGSFDQDFMYFLQNRGHVGGQWQVDGDSVIYPYEGWGTKKAVFKKIAQVDSNLTPSNIKLRRYTARLIAAAPDLLGIVKSLESAETLEDLKGLKLQAIAALDVALARSADLALADFKWVTFESARIAEEKKKRQEALDKARIAKEKEIRLACEYIKKGESDECSELFESTDSYCASCKTLNGIGV